MGNGVILIEIYVNVYVFLEKPFGIFNETNELLCFSAETCC